MAKRTKQMEEIVDAFGDYMKTEIDYFVLIYNDDITQPFKGDVMKQCLANVHNQTVPVHVVLLCAECTPQSTLDYIKETYPNTDLIIRSKELDWIVDCMEHYYNNSIADMVMFSKIISVPYLNRAEVHTQMFEQYPESIGSLAGMNKIFDLDDVSKNIVYIYQLSPNHGVGQGSPSTWCFHKKNWPILHYLDVNNKPRSDAYFLNDLALHYSLVAIQIPLIDYYWDPRVRPRTCSAISFTEYANYWRTVRHRAIPFIKGEINNETKNKN